ncbi:DUF924 family protein [Colwellia psychrerythraea]|uniref:DUF924 domain-containing protein n=1 Tax=Colwellia psychrerythraea TaxID=28229 RepID=A0A099KSJ3_COLPS|nr:DUF924 family protein [Colwellia psychrerythraea]KGJ92857.1 protein of unknown function DUF924 [Colwellia psychrerythraea]
MNYQAVLDFWFREIDPACWWVKDIKFDQEIMSKFQEVHHAARHGELAHWRETLSGRLAEIIVLDQFSRNMYRDTPQAFANDGIALVLAQEAIALGADKTLTSIENSFLYMPFMHSESLLIHEKALALYQANGIVNNVEFELKHKEIIERFGRYPHRNNILNRQSTAEELEFLNQPGSSF